MPEWERPGSQSDHAWLVSRVDGCPRVAMGHKLRAWVPPSGDGAPPSFTAEHEAIAYTREMTGRRLKNRPAGVTVCRRALCGGKVDVAKSRSEWLQ
eukprot:7086211-Prymnesium_polylepis.1